MGSRGWHAVAAAAWLLAVACASAQPAKPVEPTKAAETKASALKLPDGTVVLFSKSPSELNPPVTGVMLSTAEYQALLDQSEAFKKQRELSKPVAPSSIAIRGAIERRGERLVAVLNATYAIRTTQANASVPLGGAKAALIAAKAADGSVPLLSADGTGYAASIEVPGTHQLTLDFEVPVGPKGLAGGSGFDLSLPKAAIASLVLDAGRVAAGTLTIGTRSLEASATIKRTAVTKDALAAKPVALGATDLLELAWEPPSKATAPTVESDVRVRIEAQQVRTVATFRLPGSRSEWQLALPAGAEVNVERGGAIPATLPAANVTVVKPSDPKKPLWTIRLPAEAATAEWVATATIVEPRTPAAEPNSKRIESIGPFHVPGVRQAGRLGVSGPFGLRLGATGGNDARRIDRPPGSDDDLVALFQLTVPESAKPDPWVVVDVRPAPSTPRVALRHRLRLQPGGWKLETTVRVVPPPRIELETLQLSIPAAWRSLEAGPAELIESLGERAATGESSTVPIRFATPQRTAFEFVLTALGPIEPMAKDGRWLLPRVLQADDRDGKLSASVPEGLQVAATAYGYEQDLPATVGESLKPVQRSGVPNALSGEFERGVAAVDLAWQPYRPELACEHRAEITVHPGQFAVVQRFEFKFADGDLRPVKFRGLAEALGLRDRPRIDPLGPGEWEWRWTAEAGKDAILTLSYALKAPPEGTDRFVLPLFWPEQATRLETNLRLWNGGGPRWSAADGGWRERAHELDPERDQWPWATLAASSQTPLELEKPTAGGDTVLVERAAMRAVINDDGTSAIRARFRLNRWPASGIVLERPAGATWQVSLDGRRIDPKPREGGWAIEDVAGQGGSPRVLDIRQLVPGDRQVPLRRWVDPPRIRRAAYLVPIRWQLVGPMRTTLLSTSRDVPFGTDWRWATVGLGPASGSTTDDLDRWFAEELPEGEREAFELPGSRDRIDFAAAELVSVNAIAVPRFAWVAVLSFSGFVAVVVLSRLGSTMLALVLVAGAIVVAVAIALIPHAVAQAIPALQPGIVIGLLLLGSRAAYLQWRRRHDDRRATFRRTLPTSGSVSIEGSKPAAASP